MDNRQELLTQALHLFAARGYASVGVQEIVEAAIVTKPTLYHYFGSKSGLLEALLEAHYPPLLDSLRKSADYQGDLVMTLRCITQTYFNFALTKPQFYSLQLSLWYAPPESEAKRAVLLYIQEQQAALEDTFQAAVPQHGNLHGHQQAYAITLKGMLDSYIAFSFSGGPPLDESLVNQLVQQFMYGIYSL